MNTKTIVLFRNVMLACTAVIMFIGGQFSNHQGGEPYTFLEALTLTTLMLSLQLLMWSKYMHNKIIEGGINVSNHLYQIIGFFVVFLFFIVIIFATYNGLSS